MMRDRFGRRIHYLRVSVTDRCNLRCRYCMPPEGVELLPGEQILSLEEIRQVVRAGAGMGIDRVRLTGGEPLVRRGIVELTRMLARIEGIGDLAMSTNGIFLSEYAAPLARAGLDRVNVSLDTTDPVRYREITRGGDLGRVLEGIEAAREEGLTPVKLNCVVQQSGDEPNARQVTDFAEANGLEARFIPRMDLSAGRFSVVEGGSGGECSRCGRLRLTSDGMLRPCLFSDLSFSVRELVAEEAFRRAVAAKPREGTSSSIKSFSRIGG